MKRQKKTGPTEARAPGEPPANVPPGPPIAALDRVRDAPNRKKVALLAAVAGVLGLIAWRSVRRRGSD